MKNKKEKRKIMTKRKKEKKREEKEKGFCKKKIQTKHHQLDYTNHLFENKPRYGGKNAQLILEK